ncbi:DUF2247 family protein [Bacillus sp. FSL K6-1003]|uniref:DUF2247 family protein n=1 Tax=Bacillus sp. FSL K6-1003 TaxID=2954675 RepID=UPI0030CFF46A
MSVYVDVLKQYKIKYDWKTLYVGLKLDLINYGDVTNYAVDFLTRHPETNDQNIIQLAWGDQDFDYESLLLSILKESNIDGLNLDADALQVEKRKWRFGMLVFLKKKHQKDSEELLNQIAEVYADFNYPEDMDSFINYLPSKDNLQSKYSKEENIARLINLFNEFLNKEHKYLQN